MNEALKTIMDKYDAIQEAKELSNFDIEKHMEIAQESIEEKYDYRKILEELEK